MSQTIEVPTMRHEDIRSRDISGLSEQARKRAFGVQMLIFDNRDNLFVWHDPDGHKVEGQVLGETVIFPNSRQARLNASSGGGELYEDLEAVARRELQEEFGDWAIGDGRLDVQNHVPLFICYQENPDNATGRVLAGVIVHWHLEKGGIEQLSHIGNFWKPDTVIRAMHQRPEVFRPAFRHAVAVHTINSDSAELQRMTIEYNMRYAHAILERAAEGIAVDFGVMGLNKVVYEG